jgi:hypothetical protein
MSFGHDLVGWCEENLKGKFEKFEFSILSQKVK